MTSESAQTLSPARGQRRHITVLFTDISNSSAYAERLDAEEYATTLDRFKRIATEVVEQHKGCIARLQGDGLLAVFGHVMTKETDGRDAVLAALDLHAQAAKLNVGEGQVFAPMQLHSGIHAGLVLLLEGDMERGRLDLVGEVPNTAARLCSMANAGEIWCSVDTLGRTAAHFKTTPMPQLKLRGRAAVLDTFRIDGALTEQLLLPKAIPLQGDTRHFVGREEELALVHHHLLNRNKDQTVLAHVTGEPGVGKSSFVHTWTEALHAPSTRNYAVLHAHCDDHLGAQPLQVLRRWLYQLLGLPASDLTTQAAAVRERARQALSGIHCAQDSSQGSSQGSSHDGAHDSSHDSSYDVLLDVLYGSGHSPDASILALKAFAVQGAALIRQYAQQTALVLVIDDWQWVDDASRRVVDQLWQSQSAAMMLVASRPLAQPEPWLSRGLVLALKPLDQPQSIAAIAAWLPNHSPFVAQDIYQLSGGNPLFIHELCLAAQSGQLYAKHSNSRVAWLNALVASRVDVLTHQQQTVLQTCAVLGHEFEAAALRLLFPQLPPEEVSRTLEGLIGKSFLTQKNAATYAFVHLITKEAVYATVQLQLRKALHLQVAQTLQHLAASTHTPEQLAQLAHHFEAAQVPEPTAHYAEAAGTQALALMSLDRARVLFLTALRALDHRLPQDPQLTQRWCRVSEKLGQACVFDPLDVGQALQIFDKAAHLAAAGQDTNAFARAHYWLAYVNYGRGQARQAIHHCEIAMQAAIESQDQRLVAQLQATLAQSLASAGQYARAIPLLRESVAAKSQLARPGSGTAIGSAYTLARLGFTLGDLGQFAQAHDAFAQSLHLLGEAQHSVKASVLELRSVVYLWEERLDEAIQVGLDGTQMALQTRSHYLVAMGQALTACASWIKSPSTDALAQLSTAIAWIEANGGAVSVSLLYGHLVQAHLHLGQVPEARAAAAKLMRRLRAQDCQGVGMGARALARWYATRAQAATLRYLKLAEKVATQRDSPREHALNALTRAQISAHPLSTLH